MQQLSVVVSGFGPYEHVDVNPSQLVPQIIAERGIHADETNLDDALRGVEVNVHAVTMPVSYAGSWTLLKSELERVQPDIVVATGLKRTARGILLERGAVNRTDSTRPDADDVVGGTGPINENGPAAYWTRLPLRSILHAFTQDHTIPASLTSDAGTYVCNALFYQLQDWAARQQRDVLTGFVSLPLVNETPHPQHGLPLERQIAAIDHVIRESARYLLENPTAQSADE
ncbi:peptidase C15 [Bifidobacterium dolichotidis]|uniref:Pyrrolidone-carboxylate peptidase n=1 Tax=Bifidobacterium dolichotidis TaxID=2306976 RepID=A0A430FQC4_9BIFI|nr:pyroglutamyl-peptidase I [Bifidobacterium dolichotidis]RSX55031.1 peptidase C15 [Bifidobacterium dolichotidis]